MAGGTKKFSLGFNVVLALKKVNNIVTINLNTGLTLLFVKVSEILSEFNLWLYFQSHFRVHFKDPTPSSVPKIYENSPPFVSELLECACVIYPCHYSFVFLCTHRTTLQPNGLIRSPLRIGRMANIIPYPFLWMSSACRSCYSTIIWWDVKENQTVEQRKIIWFVTHESSNFCEMIK